MLFSILGVSCSRRIRTACLDAFSGPKAACRNGPVSGCKSSVSKCDDVGDKVIVNEQDLKMVGALYADVQPLTLLTPGNRQPQTEGHYPLRQ